MILGVFIVCLCFGWVYAPQGNAQQFSDVDALIIVSLGFGVIIVILIGVVLWKRRT